MRAPSSTDRGPLGCRAFGACCRPIRSEHAYVHDTRPRRHILEASAGKTLFDKQFQRRRHEFGGTCFLAALTGVGERFQANNLSY